MHHIIHRKSWVCGKQYTTRISCRNNSLKTKIIYVKLALTVSLQGFIFE